MIGVVIATHGRLAEELLGAAERIVGPLAGARAVAVSAAVPLDESRAALAGAVRSLDDGDGVLVLADMLGGTPANLALPLLGDRVELVTGVNLPMLLKLSTCRTPGARLDDVAQLICEYGRRHVARPAQALRDAAGGATGGATGGAAGTGAGGGA